MDSLFSRAFKVEYTVESEILNHHKYDYNYYEIGVMEHCIASPVG